MLKSQTFYFILYSKPKPKLNFVGDLLNYFRLKGRKIYYFNLDKIFVFKCINQDKNKSALIISLHSLYTM